MNNAFKPLRISRLAGLTNKNYLITIFSKQYVLRIPRETSNANINRQNEIINSKIAYQLGISPKSLWQNKKGISISPYLRNAITLSKQDLSKPKHLKKIAYNLRKLQQSNIKFSGELDSNKIKTLLDYYFQACTKTKQQFLLDDYQKAKQMLDKLKENNLVPAHIDLVAENILLKNKKIWFIDWEYSAMASPYWDIATICNQGKLDTKDKQLLLTTVLTNFKSNNTNISMQTLLKYQHITKTITNCWLGVYCGKAMLKQIPIQDLI